MGKNSPARPSLTPKHTRTTTAKADAELDSGLRITLGGETFEARIGDVTSALVRELRRETGYGFYGLCEAVAREPDIDVIATFVWIARRIRGEDVALDEVEVAYADLLADGFDIVEAGAGKADGSPEA